MSENTGSPIFQRPLTESLSTPPAPFAVDPARAPLPPPRPVLSIADPNLRSKLVAAANSLPDLISKAETFDPDLAEQLRGKALIASKTPWGTVLGGIIAWVVAHYGLNVDPGTQTVIAGLGVLAASYIMRYITKGPVTGVLVQGDPAANPQAFVAKGDARG